MSSVTITGQRYLNNYIRSLSMQGYLNNLRNKKTCWMIAYQKWIRTYYIGEGPVSVPLFLFCFSVLLFYFYPWSFQKPMSILLQSTAQKSQKLNDYCSSCIVTVTSFNLWCRTEIFSFFSYREFKIRVRQDTELFTDDFKAENSDFDPAQVVTGNVQGTVLTLQLSLLTNILFKRKWAVSGDAISIGSN